MKWSSEQSSIAIALRQQLKTYPQIGAILGRSDQQVARFFKRLSERGREFGPKNSAASTLTRAGIGRVEIPQDVLFDRDRRLNAPRTLTMILCGDPV